MNNEKLIINSDGGKLLLGAHFHQLVDKTQTTFETEHLGEFAKYMEGEDHALLVLCGEKDITARAKEPDRYTQAVAHCKLEHSQALTELLQVANRKVPMAEFTEFLESFKRFTSAQGVALLDNLRNFKMKKVMDVQSTKDTKGNFSYRVALETGGNDDFVPPDSVVFAVPVWRNVDALFTHTFELHFSVLGASNSPVLGFTLKSFNLDDQLQVRKKEIVDEALKDAKQVRRWGSQTIHKQDDAWQYFSNPLPEGEAAKKQMDANNAYRTR